MVRLKVKKYFVVFQTHAVPKNGDLWFSSNPMSAPAAQVSRPLISLANTDVMQFVSAVLGSKQMEHAKEPGMQMDFAFLVCGSSGTNRNSLAGLHSLMYVTLSARVLRFIVESSWYQVSPAPSRPCCSSFASLSFQRRRYVPW
jgi:hypothetical protein